MITVKRQVLLLIRVVWDFMKGIYAFGFIEPCVTIFGSARTQDADLYKSARALGKALSDCGLTIMTGGGPGLMEAANRGAREGGGRSVACRIRLSFEQSANVYLDRCVTFRYFFVRKVMMLRSSCALVVLPGGFGTLDELFEVLTLIQTKKLSPLPIVFIGKLYWQPLLAVFERMVSAGTISAADLDFIERRVLITDDVDEAVAHIKTHSSRAFLIRERVPVRACVSPGKSMVPISDAPRLMRGAVDDSN